MLRKVLGMKGLKYHTIQPDAIGTVQFTITMFSNPFFLLHVISVILKLAEYITKNIVFFIQE